MDHKVSLVMSVYNGAMYLKESIGSILSQSFSDLELVVIDDASTDATPEIIKNLSLQDSRIRVIRNERNLGLTKSLNKGIAMARGEFIARMDADDISLPERIEKQVNFLNLNSECGVVGTGADIIDASGRVTRTIIYPESNEELQRILIKYNPFFHSSIMMRRSVLNDVGFYNETWKFAQDYELLLRIARKYKVGNLKEVLLRYREIPGSITAKKNRAQIGFVLKAKVEALKRGQFPIYKVVYLVPTVISWLLPVAVKRYIKNIIRR